MVLILSLMMDMKMFAMMKVNKTTTMTMKSGEEIFLLL